VLSGVEVVAAGPATIFIVRLVMEVPMRRFAIFLLVVAAGCGTSTTPQADQGQKDTPRSKPPSVEIKSEHDYQGWKEYAPSEAAFEVRFPTEPVVNTPTPATGNFHVAGVQRRAVDELGYTCQWTIKEKAYSSEAEGAYLRGQQAGALKSSKGKLVEEKDITLDGVPGREFIIELADKNVFRIRTYLAGKRMITLQVVGKDTESVRSLDAVKFFESLKISK
jgi:hypothetical protein